MTSKRLPAALRDGGLLEAITSDKPSPAAYECLWLASQLWIADGGKLPMQRYFSVLATAASMEKAGRDVWLRKAAKLIQTGTPFSKAHELANELEKFITRGPWNTWRNLNREHPPTESSELRAALFYVAKFNNGELLSKQTIYRALS